MEKDFLIREISDYIAKNNENIISKEDAIFPELAGVKIFDEPIVGFASASDELFTVEFKKPGVIHPEYRDPGQWLEGAKTVVSFFLPFTEEVKISNRLPKDEPYEEGTENITSSPLWLHARIEGQDFIDSLTDRVEKVLQDAGYNTICPTTSGELRMITPYISTWSERHTAYVAGLGTFGLSKGLITKKGMAGRFGSVITDAVFEPSVREYSSPFEYCIMCRACERKCQVKAIDASRGVILGKDQDICGPYLKNGTLKPHGPREVSRYGCGKCQCGVPCESRIPQRA